MKREYARTERVGEQVRRDLADLIRSSLDDPRMAMVSITDVEVSRDLGHARVFVTYIGDETLRDEIVADLNQAAGFLRAKLGRGLRLRTIPKLQFRYDQSVEHGSKLSALIDQAVETDAARHKDDDSAESPATSGDDN
jgi:ribosome-binding factor A